MNHRTTAGGDSSTAHAKQVADTLRVKYHSDPEALADDDPADWAKESFAQREFAFSPAEDPASTAESKSHTVTDAYVTKAQEIAGVRIVLAGDRLAKLLEWTFSP